jgi:hypothetical protein
MRKQKDRDGAFGGTEKAAVSVDPLDSSFTTLQLGEGTVALKPKARKHGLNSKTVKGKEGKAAASSTSRQLTSAERAIGKRASLLIDQRIRELGGWRGEALARMRALILEADPEITEEWKWMGTPVWSHHGNLCTGEVYTKVVKLTFAQGARIPDPSGLFNASLDGNTRRAIDLTEGESIDPSLFKALVKAAIVQNAASAKKR